MLGGRAAAERTHRERIEEERKVRRPTPDVGHTGTTAQCDKEQHERGHSESPTPNNIDNSPEDREKRDQSSEPPLDWELPPDYDHEEGCPNGDLPPKHDQAANPVPPNNFTSETECRFCGGSGVADCPNCGGSGKVHLAQGFYSVDSRCPLCKGKGKSEVPGDCWHCGGTGRLRYNLRCPKCGYDDWKAASLVYEEGTSAINTTTKAAGVGIGSGGIGVGFGGGTTTGKSQTALSERAAPPAGTGVTLVLFQALIGLGIIAFFVPGLRTTLFWVALVVIILLAVTSLAESTDKDTKTKEWGKMRVCTRCGDMYPEYEPGTRHSPS